MIGRIEVIEEDASDAPRLLSVGDVKVFVAPFLEGAIENSWSVSITGVFEGLVEMCRVRLVEIRWCQIASSSKPPSRNLRRVFRVGYFEVAIVCVDGRRVRVARVDDQADAGGEEGECSLSVVGI